MPAKKPKPRKPIKNAPLTRGVSKVRLAQALALADLSGLAVAAQQFGMGKRSIARYRDRIKRGELPDLATMVQEQAKTIAEASKDLLDSVFEAYLSRMRELAKTANHGQASMIFEKLAEAKFTRESLTNGSPQQGSGESQSATASAAVIVLNQPAK